MNVHRYFNLAPFPLLLPKGFPSAAPGALVRGTMPLHGSPFAPGEPAGLAVRLPRRPASPYRVFRPFGFIYVFPDIRDYKPSCPPCRHNLFSASRFSFFSDYIRILWKYKNHNLYATFPRQKPGNFSPPGFMKHVNIKGGN